jgi:hypothetical protein
MIEFSAVLVVGDEGPDVLGAALASFRARYGQVPLAVISDGVDDQGYRRACDTYHARYTLDRYYGRIECGGRWWRRSLAVGLALDRKWIVSVDLSAGCWPDLEIEPSRPVARIPRDGDREHARQSCWLAIRHDVATTLIDTGCLSNPDLTMYQRLCGAANIPSAWIPTGRIAPALVLRHVCTRLGIECDGWPNGCEDAAAMVSSSLQGRGVASDTPLIIIATCKGRRHHLEHTLPGWLAERYVHVVVVDYDCPDDTGSWLAARYPEVRVASVREQPTFNLARARNIGARAAPSGWWAFLDADTMVAPGWADAVRSVLSRGRYHLADPVTPPMHGTCIVHSTDFHSSGGYDDFIEGWGAEDLDLYGRFRQCNIRPAFWDGRLAQTIKHSDLERTQFYHHGKRASACWNGQYVWAKHALMIAAWRLPTGEECRKLRAALTSERTTRASDGCA